MEVLKRVLVIGYEGIIIGENINVYVGCQGGGYSFGLFLIRYIVF